MQQTCGSFRMTLLLKTTSHATSLHRKCFNFRLMTAVTPAVKRFKRNRSWHCVEHVHMCGCGVHEVAKHFTFLGNLADRKVFGRLENVAFNLPDVQEIGRRVGE